MMAFVKIFIANYLSIRENMVVSDIGIEQDKKY